MGCDVLHFFPRLVLPWAYTQAQLECEHTTYFTAFVVTMTVDALFVLWAACFVCDGICAT